MKIASDRAYPWPYKAALAFASDCDFLTLDAMMSLHHLFAAAPADGGFGLEMSESFFFYAVGSRWPCYSYFESLSNTETKAAPVIRELVRTGHLDAVHGLGDFEVGGFRRQLGHWAKDSFAKHGLKIPIWSNHGGYQNRQNIGVKDLCYYHAGDDFNSPFYMLDIAEDMGVKYVWTDGLLAKDFPQRPCGPVVTERERRAPRKRYVWPVQRIQEEYEPKWSFDRKDIFERLETRSGAILQGFVRYDGFMLDGNNGNSRDSLVKPDGVRPGPNLGRIGNTLAPDKLDRLTAEEGCAILYQHFSTIAHLPERTHLSRELEFHPENISGLQELKRRESKGEIWVAALAHLLDYLYMINTIDVRERGSNSGTLEFTVSAKKGYEYRGAAGLTVAIGKEPRRAVISEPGSNVIECETVGPDSDGQYWARVPVCKLNKIDWLHLAKENGVEINSDLTLQILDGAKPANLWLPEAREKRRLTAATLQSEKIRGRAGGDSGGKITVVSVDALSYSGTTWLNLVLGSHPDVFALGPPWRIWKLKDEGFKGANLVWGDDDTFWSGFDRYWDRSENFLVALARYRKCTHIIFDNPSPEFRETVIQHPQIVEKRMRYLRDARAVTASFARKNADKTYLETILPSGWFYHSFMQVAPPDDQSAYPVFYYEKCLADPRAFLAHARDYLGVAYTDAALRFWEWDHQITFGNPGTISLLKMAKGVNVATSEEASFYAERLENLKKHPLHGFTDDRWATQLGTLDRLYFDMLMGEHHAKLGYRRDTFEDGYLRQLIKQHEVETPKRKGIDLPPGAIESYLEKRRQNTEK